MCAFASPWSFADVPLQVHIYVLQLLGAECDLAYQLATEIVHDLLGPLCRLL